jgi:hypothetical protein
MNDPISILSGRAMGAFPLSIGTSLAFESLFDGRQAAYDPERKLPPRIKIDDYSYMLINVATLIRNIVTSITGDEVYSLNSNAILLALKEEINTIIDIFSNEGQNKLKLYFYVREYKFVKRLSSSKLVVFREAHTEKQKILEGQLYSTERDLKKIPDLDFIHYVGSELHKSVSKNALILTNVAYDLLSYNKFDTLNLLESHTGLLKTRKDFYTKFIDGKKLELSNIPFTRKLLAVFGDSIIYKQMPMFVRKQIIELAHARKWTAVTTETKVDFDVANFASDLGLKIEFIKF